VHSTLEAIRRLVALGLRVKTPAQPIGKPGRRLRAQELATKAIEKIIDPAAAPEEQAQRRRRLTKGPPEFREDRVDPSKRKQGRIEIVSKKPSIDHEYHAGKDKLDITIKGYSPSKKTRDAIIKKLMQQLESSPDRLVADTKKSKKARDKRPRNPQKDSKLIVVGD
jgi:hypothetical protein